MPLPNWNTVDSFTALKECLSNAGEDTSNTDSVIELARKLSYLSEKEKKQLIASAVLLGIGGGGGSGDLTEVAIPVSSAAAGASGQYAVDGDYFYIYETSVSEWRRCAIEQW